MSEPDDESDYEVGYKKPPKATRFGPGNRANPNGRAGKNRKRKKAAAPESEAAILARLEGELIEFQGNMITKREAGMRVLLAKALNGDTKAMTLLERIRAKTPAEQPETIGGVLLLPSDVPLNEWEAAAAIQQAQYRGDLPPGDEADRAEAALAKKVGSDEGEE